MQVHDSFFLNDQQFKVLISSGRLARDRWPPSPYPSSPFLHNALTSMSEGAHTKFLQKLLIESEQTPF